MPKKNVRKNNALISAIAGAATSDIAGRIWGGAKDFAKKKLTPKKKKIHGTGKAINPSKQSFIGVRVNGSQVQLKLPNRKAETILAAREIVKKLRKSR